MVEVGIGSFERPFKAYVSSSPDKRLLQKIGQIEGLLGVDRALRILGWEDSSLESYRGGGVLAIRPTGKMGEQFLQFVPPDMLMGQRNANVTFDTGASGVQIDMRSVRNGVEASKSPGSEVVILNDLGNKGVGAFSLERSGTATFRIPGNKSWTNPEDLQLYDGGSGANSSMVYSMGEAGQVIINNVDPDEVRKTAEGVHVRAENEYGEVVGTFGNDGSVLVVIKPKVLRLR